MLHFQRYKDIPICLKRPWIQYHIVPQAASLDTVHRFMLKINLIYFGQNNLTPPPKMAPPPKQNNSTKFVCQIIYSKILYDV